MIHTPCRGGQGGKAIACPDRGIKNIAREMVFSMSRAIKTTISGVFRPPRVSTTIGWRRVAPSFGASFATPAVPSGAGAGRALAVAAAAGRLRRRRRWGGRGGGGGWEGTGKAFRVAGRVQRFGLTVASAVSICSGAGTIMSTAFGEWATKRCRRVAGMPA